MAVVLSFLHMNSIINMTCKLSTTDRLPAPDCSCAFVPPIECPDSFSLHLQPLHPARDCTVQQTLQTSQSG